MPKYEVYASETIYESCIVEANSPEEAMNKVSNGDGRWTWDIHDSDDFEISDAELVEEEE